MNWIKETFVLDPNNIVFINNINNRLFTPNILFGGYKIEDVSNHSMGLRKPNRYIRIDIKLLINKLKELGLMKRE